MKKLVLTTAILIGLTMGTYARDYYFIDDFYDFIDDFYDGIYDYGDYYDGNYFGDGSYFENIDYCFENIGYFGNGGYHGGGGLFGRGSTQMRGWSSDGFLFFPGHASYGNWNSDPDGPTDYPPDPEVPLGGGTLLLIGFGTAYAMKKRDK